MDYGKTVEYAVSVIVKLGQVDGLGGLLQSLIYKAGGAVGGVVYFASRDSYPGSDGGLDVECAVGILQIVVAEGAYPEIALLVHVVVEILLGIGGLGVGEVDQQHQQAAFAPGGEGVVDLCGRGLRRARFPGRSEFLQADRTEKPVGIAHESGAVRGYRP